MSNKGSSVGTPYVSVTEAQTGFLGVEFEVLASDIVCKPLAPCKSSVPWFPYNYIGMTTLPI